MDASSARVSKAVRVAGLVLATGAISVLHYVTDPSLIVWHEVYQRLYYVPLILAAYWYGVRGGLLMALFTSLAYLPHLRFTWSANLPYSVAQYAALVMFHAIGLLVGLLATSERRLTLRYRDVAASLEQANRDLHTSYEQLRRADRLSMLGQVAAGLAHEIRNPLGSITGALEILASRAKAGTPDSEFCQLAMKETRRLDDLVTQFLTFARPGVPELRETNLSDVVDHVGNLLQPEAVRAQVSLDITCEEPLPPLLADPQQLEQVLVNVVLNAVQASPAGSRVRVAGWVHENAATVEVTDEGPGISPEDRPRVFDPFFTTKKGGTGLGLAVSARIVSAHHGTIEALDASGGGTRIRIRLPLAGSSRGKAAESRSTA